jgi:hypothetical protein
MAEGIAYSFELNPEMLELINKEFDMKAMAERFAAAVKGKSAEETAKIAAEMFTAYGTEWMQRTLQLGEEYPDRTYEVLKQAIDKTGGYYRFALLPQRFIEIAYLATEEFPSLAVVENNQKALVYKVPDCVMYRSLKEACGEAVANAVPCKHACLTALKVAHQEFELDARMGMDAEIAKEGYCEFYARAI